MPKARFAFIAAVVIALACIPVVFLAKHSPPMQLHFLRAAPVAEGMNVFFEVRNRPLNFQAMAPVGMQTSNGATWKECPGGFGEWTQFEETTNFVFCCALDRRVTGRLRLVTQYQTTLNPLESFIARVKLRTSGRNTRVPLNPFNKSVAVFSDPTVVITEEFTLEFTLP